MSILKEIRDEIKDEIKYYSQLTRDTVSDYKESHIKIRIAKQEEEKARTLKAKHARYSYYTELITQCNINVNMIRAMINTNNATLTSLGERGNKAIRERLTLNIKWLNIKLKEEEFLVIHYNKLRNEQ